MDIPGSDLLGVAMGLINPQSVEYYRNTGRTAGSVTGREKPTFADMVEVDTGSVQSVPRSRYAYYGLDVQKNYINWYVEQTVIDVQRDFSGDRLVWNGRIFQLTSALDWYGQDGWVGVICVDIGPNTGNAPFNNVPFTGTPI